MNEVLTSIDADLASRALAQSMQALWPRYGRVKIEYAVVDVEALKTVIDKVTPARLSAAMGIFQGMIEHGVPPYLPVAHAGDVNQKRVAFGPLVERHGDRLLLIDGVHRSLVARAEGHDSIYAVLIEAEFVPPPPGPVFNLVDAETVVTDQARLPLYPGRSSVYFRPSARFTELAQEKILRWVATES